MFKRIKDFPNYLVCDDGTVWSCYKDKWLSPGKQVNGYLFVNLYRRGKHKQCRVHRLVLEAFVGPCPKGYWACHNNGNNQDNRLSNLRWDTISNNHLDKRKHGTDSRGEKCYAAKLKDKDVINIIRLYNTKLFCQWEIAKLYKISQTMVSKIILGKNWKHLQL